MKKITIENEELWLLPEKAVFWQKRHTLIVSDLHLGKGSHFRKHGVPVPNHFNQKDLELLSCLIDSYALQRIIITGDLFHSRLNEEWEVFYQWRQQYPALKIVLVKGNHDILPAMQYAKLNIEVFPSCLDEAPFLFCHDCMDFQPENRYLISGHVHPAISLSGKAKQFFTLECFYFAANSAILPAFGSFTGKEVIKPAPLSRVFAIADSEVFEINSY